MKFPLPPPSTYTGNTVMSKCRKMLRCICLAATQPVKIIQKRTQPANRGNSARPRKLSNTMNIIWFSRTPAIATNCENKLFVVQEKVK